MRALTTSSAASENFENVFVAGIPDVVLVVRTVKLISLQSFAFLKRKFGCSTHTRENQREIL